MTNQKWCPKSPQSPLHAKVVIIRLIYTKSFAVQVHLKRLLHFLCFPIISVTDQCNAILAYKLFDVVLLHCIMCSFLCRDAAVQGLETDYTMNSEYK